MESAGHTGLGVGAGLAIAAIAFVTVLPIELRPTTSLSPNRERFRVMAIVGGLFVLAYPRRVLVVIIALSAAVAVLEPLQYFASGRHPSVHDAMIKSAGASAGAVVACILARAAMWLRRRRREFI